MEIYFLPFLSLSWNKSDLQLMEHVSPERKKKIQSYLKDSDRKLSLYAALVARMGLSKATGIPSSELFFTTSPNQKPKLCSSTIDFSFSHTNDAILCAISLTSFVGADIESIKSAPFEVMDLIFHNDEINYIKTAPISLKNLRFYKIWTQKEAFSKYISSGLSEAFVNINMLDPYFSSRCYSWIEGKYICSVFTSTDNHINKQYLKELDLINFFCNSD